MRHTVSIPFLALSGQLVTRAWRVFKNRRQFAELKYWTDEQLKDVGLTRSDVRRAMAQPFYTDPTSLLNSAPALRQTSPLRAANGPQTAPALTLVSECQKSGGKLAA